MECMTVHRGKGFEGLLNKYFESKLQAGQKGG